MHEGQAHWHQHRFLQFGLIRLWMMSVHFPSLFQHTSISLLFPTWNASIGETGPLASQRHPPQHTHAHKHRRIKFSPTASPWHLSFNMSLCPCGVDVDYRNLMRAGWLQGQDAPSRRLCAPWVGLSCRPAQSGDTKNHHCLDPLLHQSLQTAGVQSLPSVLIFKACDAAVRPSTSLCVRSSLRGWISPLVSVLPSLPSRLWSVPFYPSGSIRRLYSWRENIISSISLRTFKKIYLFPTVVAFSQLELRVSRSWKILLMF